MGLSVAIAGGIVMVTIMLVMLTIPNLVNNIFSIGEISSKNSKIEDTISKTEISVEEIYTKTGSPRVNFTLNNEGSITLWDFNKFNVLIEYTGEVSGKITEPLSYFGECLGAAPPTGQWCIQSISNDVADPKLLNFGETANIRTSLDENLASLTTIVAVATDNGVTFKTSGTAIETSIPSPNSVNPKKWGQIMVTSAVGQLLGLLSTSMIFDGGEAIAYDVANADLAITSTSGGAGTNAGMHQTAALFQIYRLDQDPRYVLKFRTNEITTNRLFIGFRDGGAALPNAGDGLLTGLNGVGLCINSTSTTYQFCHNDGVGLTVWDDTGITEDTLVHTVEVYGESANNQWCLKIDTYSPFCASTEIPAATTRMWMNGNAESVDASTTQLIYYNAYVEINPP
jgi:hypothetical protein